MEELKVYINKKKYSLKKAKEKADLWRDNTLYQIVRCQLELLDDIEKIIKK